MELNIDTIEKVKSSHEQGLGISEIKEIFEGNVIPENQVEEQVKIIRLIKYKRLRNIGFKCLGAGALFCLGGGLLTFLHDDYSTLYAAFTLYGMTITGALLILAGLAMVLGL